MSRPRLVLAGLAAALMAPAMHSVSVRMSEEVEPPFPALDLLGSGRAPRSSPNGGHRHFVAQAKRAARKRRNQLRAKGQHREAAR